MSLAIIPCSTYAVTHAACARMHVGVISADVMSGATLGSRLSTLDGCRSTGRRCGRVHGVETVGGSFLRPPYPPGSPSKLPSLRSALRGLDGCTRRLWRAPKGASPWHGINDSESTIWRGRICARSQPSPRIWRD